MTGDRWPDKRARAVLFAGANKLQKEHPGLDPDQVADLGIEVRALLFLDDEVREENADVKAHRIGYTADCMQFATIEPAPEGLLLDLWVGSDRMDAAKEALGAAEHTNPFRRMYGWARVPLRPGQVPGPLGEWIGTARRHAAETKSGQRVQM